MLCPLAASFSGLRSQDPVQQITVSRLEEGLVSVKVLPSQRHAVQCKRSRTP